MASRYYDYGMVEKVVTEPDNHSERNRSFMRKWVSGRGSKSETRLPFPLTAIP
jgi:hypothetical protein